MACSVQCLMCSMKCTGADAGVFAGAGAVCSVHLEGHIDLEAPGPWPLARGSCVIGTGISTGVSLSD